MPIRYFSPTEIGQIAKRIGQGQAGVSHVEVVGLTKLWRLDPLDGG